MEGPTWKRVGPFLWRAARCRMALRTRTTSRHRCGVHSSRSDVALPGQRRITPWPRGQARRVPALLRATSRTTQQLQHVFDQGTGRDAAELGERDRIHLAAMVALAADQQDLELSEVIRETSDRARHAPILKSAPVPGPSSALHRQLLYGFRERSERRRATLRRLLRLRRKA